ncbi:MAG: TetR/AcrR family transcriptional regulator [Acidimicrobiales bacterium]
MSDAVADRSAWRERAAATRRRRSEAAVLDAARRLVSAGGFEATTVEAIAAEAGVGPATVYERYGSKAGVAIALLYEHLGDLDTPAARDAATRPVAEAVYRHMLRVARKWRAHPELGPAVFSAMSRLVGLPRGRDDPRVRYPLPRPLVAILRAGQDRGEIAGDLDVEDAAGSLTSFLMLRLITRDEPAAASASFVARLAMRGLLADPRGEVE